MTNQNLTEITDEECMAFVNAIPCWVWNGKDYTSDYGSVRTKVNSFGINIEVYVIGQPSGYVDIKRVQSKKSPHEFDLDISKIMRGKDVISVDDKFFKGVREEGCDRIRRATEKSNKIRKEGKR
jgi:hypothetical protein